MSEPPFDEEEAARRLGIKKSALTTARARGYISPMRLSPRVIRYTQEMLDEYRTRFPAVEDTESLLARAMQAKAPITVGCGVYFLWDGDEIVYVGRTNTLHTRLASHILCKKFDSYSFLPVPERDVGRVEAELVRHIKPRLNVQFLVCNTHKGPEDECR